MRSRITRQVIRHLRRTVIELIVTECRRGRKPFLQVIIDLTTLYPTFRTLTVTYQQKVDAVVHNPLSSVSLRKQTSKTTFKTITGDGFVALF